MTDQLDSDAPALTADEWWRQVGLGRLTVLRCRRCSGTWLPWSPACPHCGDPSDPEVVEASGKGYLYSWVGVHRSFSHPDEVPFTVGAIKLEEGPQLYGRLTADSDDLAADAPVRAVFVERDGRRVIDFRVEHGT